MQRINKENNKRSTDNRIKLGFTILAGCFLLIIVKLMWIQIVKADEYTHEAISIQIGDSQIEATRGDILDRNGEKLATSIPMKSMEILPETFMESIEDTPERLDEFIKGISPILEMDYDELHEKMTSDATYVLVKKYIENTDADAIREYIYSDEYENSIRGISFTDTTKRHYPSGEFASQTLGNVNYDKKGAAGIELMYNRYLSGISGRIIKTQDILGRPLSQGVESIYEPQDGLNVLLTIDSILQHYVETTINEVHASTEAKRVMCVVMDPKTGDVLAMASTPTYDSNSPYSPTNSAQLLEYEKLEGVEQNDYMQNLWKNPIISDTYEPGSTMKLITAAATLEESLGTVDTHYNCSGGINVNGTTIGCWNNDVHGDQTLSEAVVNSCNIAHVKMVQELEKENFYKYVEKFGFDEQTGIDFPQEASPQLYDIDDIGAIELATMSYGHGISITPIQLISAISAFGNDGYLMKPRVVQGLTDEKGDMVQEIETDIVRKVISTDTANTMKDIMEGVVSEIYNNLTGYRIGGKTGTAIQAASGGYTDDRYCTFVGLAPLDDPQFAILFIVDAPQTSKQSSVVAAPPAIKILENALIHYNVEPTYTEEQLAEMEKNYVAAPDITGLKLSEAKILLENADLGYSLEGSSATTVDFVIEDQYPKGGEKIKKGGTVSIYR